jgi:glycine/D-amino acid oxidase-like deaminating enzyme
MFIVILTGISGIFAALHLAHFGFEQPVVDEPGVAFGAAHRHQRALAQPLGRVAAAHHRRDAQSRGQ